jgi:hypothetical protein
MTDTTHNSKAGERSPLDGGGVPFSVYRSIYLQPPTSCDNQHKAAVASEGCYVTITYIRVDRMLDDWREYRQCMSSWRRWRVDP